jgi:microcystin-dependent protein
MGLTLPNVPAGVFYPYAGYVLPNGHLWCDGSAISRTTYSLLYNNLVPVVGTFTVTIATPAVVTLNTHGFQTGDSVFLTTTGALPTGLSVNTLYYVIRVDANTFNLATSRANAYAATKIATSGTQSGTHSLQSCAWGLGDGSTTFNVPDMRGRAVAGNDSMGGTVASRITLARPTGAYGNQGATGGAESHQLVTAELAAHTHTGTAIGANGVAGGNANYWAGNNTGSNAPIVQNTGGDTAHNNLQPTALSNYIIKY